MTTTPHPLNNTSITLTDEMRQRAEQREAHILGAGPRMNPIEIKELTAELTAIMLRMEDVNDKLQSSAEVDRGGTQPLRDRVRADPQAAAKSPEVLAELSKLPEIVRTMLRHAQLFSVHTDVGIHLITKGTLSLRDRELAVLRTAWLCQAPYEWGEHVLVGKRFGLTSGDVENVIAGPDAATLDEHECAVLRAVDELHKDAMISDATWNTLAKQLNEQQLIELPIAVGQYHSVAYYQNSLRLRLHDGNLGLKAR